MGISKKDLSIQLKPTNFIRGGYYHYSRGGINELKNYGTYWESSPDSASDAKHLRFNSTSLAIQYSNGKGYGTSLRCLVR